MRLGWKGENLEVRMSEVEWKVNSGEVGEWRFHTFIMPSGSYGADGFFVYDASNNSGNLMR
jgi:hypothetical protein